MLVLNRKKGQKIIIITDYEGPNEDSVLIEVKKAAGIPDIGIGAKYTTKILRGELLAEVQHMHGTFFVEPNEENGRVVHYEGDNESHREITHFRGVELPAYYLFNNVEPICLKQ